MKKLLCVLLCLLMVLPMAATAEDKLFPELKEPVTVTVWHSVTNKTLYAKFEEVVTNFNNTVGKENNVVIEMVQYPSGTDLYTAMTGAIMSGDVPDITMGLSMYMNEYVKAEALVDLTPYMTSEKYGINLDDYYPCWFQTCNSFDEDKNYYAIPFMCQNENLYYNVDFLEKHNLKVPTTWEEAEEVARAASAIIGDGALGWDNGSRVLSTLSEQSGVGYVTPEGELLFDDNLDVVLEKLQWYADLVEEGVFRTPRDSMFFSGPFANQEIPMYIGSGTEGAYIDMKIDPANPFKWSCAPVPHFADGKPATYSESQMLSIVDLEEDYETRFASWLFLKYFVSEEAVYNMATAGSYLPILKSVATNEEWLAIASPSQLAGIQQMDYYFPSYGFDNGTFTSNALYLDGRTAIDTVLAGEAELETAIKDMLAAYGL